MGGSASGSRQEFTGEGGPGVFGGAFSGAPIARFKGGSGRTRGAKIDHSRRPAGARVLRPFWQQVVRFRAYAQICDSRRRFRGSPEIGIPGSRQEFTWGGVLDSGGALSDVSDACFRRGCRQKRGPKIDQLRRPAWRFLWREIWKDLVSSSPQATPCRCPWMLPATPCRPLCGPVTCAHLLLPPPHPLLSRRTPFNATNTPAGGSRPAGGRP